MGMDCFLRRGDSEAYRGRGGTGGGIIGEVALDISLGVLGLGINEGVTDLGDITLSARKSPMLLLDRNPTVDCALGARRFGVLDLGRISCVVEGLSIECGDVLLPLV